MIIIAAIIMASGMIISAVVIANALELNERVRNAIRRLDEAGESLKSTVDRNQP